MKKIFEKKINVILIIALAILVVVTIAAVVIWQVTTKNVKQEISYEDKVNCNNYFENIAINLDLKRVKRDGQDTTLKEEFGISESEADKFLQDYWKGVFRPIGDEYVLDARDFYVRVYGSGISCVSMQEMR